MEEKKEGNGKEKKKGQKKEKKMKKYNREDNQFQELHNLYNAQI